MNEVEVEEVFVECEWAEVEAIEMVDGEPVPMCRVDEWEEDWRDRASLAMGLAIGAVGGFVGWVTIGILVAVALNWLSS